VRPVVYLALSSEFTLRELQAQVLAGMGALHHGWRFEHLTCTSSAWRRISTFASLSSTTFSISRIKVVSDAADCLIGLKYF